MNLRELYQEVILDHGRHPRNFGALEGACCTARGHNPLCGDRLQVFADVEGDVVRRVRFEGQGCAISTASASIMTEAVEGMTRTEVQALFERVHALMTGADDPGGPDLDKLAVFEGVRTFPMRVKCATLPWHTLMAALTGTVHVASTE